MRKKSGEPSDGTEVARSKPNFTTSRRNLLAGSATIGFFIGSYFATRKARANPACEVSGGQPPFCACYLKGTLILTPEGEKAIEDLEIGDLVITVSGKRKPIRWIGRRRLEHPSREALPVRVAEGALGDGLPSRDLYISNAHSLLINGLLVPAIHLVNGVSIAKCTSYDGTAIEYLHLELDDHDAIFANGAPSETLAGNANRKRFDNFGEYVALYGAELTSMVPFAPVVGFHGGRQELRSRLRSVLAPVVDRREPLDTIRDEIAHRTELQRAA